MKDILIPLIAFIGTLVFLLVSLYLAVSFVEWNFNPAIWYIETRLTCGVLYFVIIMVACITALGANEKQNLRK